MERPGAAVAELTDHVDLSSWPPGTRLVVRARMASRCPVKPTRVWVMHGQLLPQTLYTATSVSFCTERRLDLRLAPPRTAPERQCLAEARQSRPRISCNKEREPDTG